MEPIPDENPEFEESAGGTGTEEREPVDDEDELDDEEAVEKEEEEEF